MFVLEHLWKLAQAQLHRKPQYGTYATFGRRLDEMLTPARPGFYVAYPDSPCRSGRAGLAMAIEHARRHHRVVSGWRNPRDGQLYFESVRPCGSRQDAFHAAMQNRQSGIYDLAQQTYTDLTNETANPQAVSA